ncbi:MAG TPA: tripartite tricarboxylate transporter substrate binding protein [Burkholderiales bacterium]|nr:tripartite tricarboxylate transporter substrate binding protein [Burkholderiales bacterium]
MVNASAIAQSERYPSRPVRVVVPYTAGGANDIFARMVLTRAVADLGQTTIVDNRPGGNTTIGTQLAARAAPDGYTLLNVDNAYTIGPSVQINLPYDTLKDFTRITMYASTSPVLVVHPSLPVKSVKELLALAQAQPGRLAYGSTGNGTTGHLAFAQIRQVTGMDAVHVPYKGGAPQITALISGEVSMLLSVPAPLLSHIKSGRMRALAVSGAKRLNALPDLPTLQESGVAVIMDSFWGVVAPAGTNAAIIKTLHEAIERVLKYADTRTRLEDMQFQIAGSAPAQFEAFVEREVQRWVGVVKATGAKVE